MSTSLISSICARSWPAGICPYEAAVQLVPMLCADHQIGRLTFLVRCHGLLGHRLLRFAAPLGKTRAEDHRLSFANAVSTSVASARPSCVLLICAQRITPRLSMTNVEG